MATKTEWKESEIKTVSNTMNTVSDSIDKHVNQLDFLTEHGRQLKRMELKRQFALRYVKFTSR